MVRRIYFESVKKWLIAAGITGGTLIGGLFLLLLSTGAISDFTFSGDSICAGTIEDPCYAYMNFTANEDIFIYPLGNDPWGRNTTFEFEPNVKSWKLQRSWGDTWRNIPLNKSCTGTWCGLSDSKDERVFSYAFRKGRTYQIRLVAMKNDPTDSIKWSAFDGQIDPYWLGVEDYIIDGTKIYINDSKIYLSAEPHTTTGSPVVVELESKIYTGDITVAFGFPSDSYKPTGLDRWNPHNVTTEYNYTCNYNFSYELTPEKRAWCYYDDDDFDDSNESRVVVFNHTFDWGNIESKTVWWSTTEVEDWTPLNWQTTKIMYEHEGVNTWRIAKNIPITKDKRYKTRINIEFPIYQIPQEKYWICLMPSSYNDNIALANANNHLYCLDPWVNGSLMTDIFGYYKFNGTITDETGNSDATNNSCTPASGLIGQSFNFGGTNDYIDSNDSPDLNNDFSVSLWFNTTMSGRGQLFSYFASTDVGEDYVQTFISSGKVFFYVRGGSGTYPTAETSSTYNDGDWHHMVFTWEGTGEDAYLIMDDTETISDTTSGISADIATINYPYLGVTSELKLDYIGKIDEFGVWTKVLTSTEITALYNSGNGITYPFQTYEADPPTYSLNSTDSTAAGASIEHRLKWNSTEGLSGYSFSFCNGSNCDSSGEAATGGTITTDGLYTIHTFTSNGTFTVSENISSASVLVVAGGGGGGGGYTSPGGGGGGAGGLIYKYANRTIANESYSVVIGSGGAGGVADTGSGNYVKSVSGKDSSFSTFVAVGGGGGGAFNGVSGQVGGSGGGMAYITGAAGAGTAGQGYGGGDGADHSQNGGGGGGASEVGGDASDTVGTVPGLGGDGLEINISGTNTNYSGGGGAGLGYNGNTAETNIAAGGAGGGGAGGENTAGNLDGVDGTDALGGGGGGGGGIINTNTDADGGDGGNGVVVIRYLTPGRTGWVEDAWVAMNGAINWSNVTKSVNATVGAEIQWCVKVNDTYDVWNSTSCDTPFKYNTTEGSTCACPAVDNDWEIDMSDHCNITDDCNLGTGTLNFTGTGYMTCNATINTTSMGNLSADQKINVSETCIIYVD